MNRGIVVAGLMMLDYNKTISVFPERNGLVNIESVYATLGGAVNNVSQDLARLDPRLPVRAIGLIGRDAAGDAILKELGKYKNIDISGIKFDEHTGFTDVLAERESKVRSFLVFPGANTRFDIEHVDIDNLDCDIFHIGYILLLDALDAPDPAYGTRMARLLDAVRRRGILTSVDIVSEAGDRYKRIVPPSLPYTDFFIVNEIEAGRTVGIEPRDPDGCLIMENIRRTLAALMGMGVKRWAVIHAPEGGFGLSAEGEFAAVPSPLLPEGFIAATVGAGDAFCAGALYAAYRGEGISRAIADGIACATASLRGSAACDGVDTYEEARALLARFPRRELY